MEHNQNYDTAINHHRTLWIKFPLHSCLFSTVAKKVTVVERLFWQFGKPFSGRYRCTEVAVLERFKKQSTYGLSKRTKKNGRCEEVATSGGSNFPGEKTHITRDMCFPGGGTHITRDMCFPGGGTHITSDMCFAGWGTHITGDMCFPGGGTHITFHFNWL